jgi:hypothetical protein
VAALTMALSIWAAIVAIGPLLAQAMRSTPPREPLSAAAAHRPPRSSASSSAGSAASRMRRAV